VYAVVRHPLYLGWLLAYPAAMLVSQHWLIVVLGAIGMASIEAITRLADRELSAKFGPEYERYMEQVPRLNMLWGLAKKLGRER
jgi:protein-S-isoprenylcysteine O-methyltransferase Ste14